MDASVPSPRDTHAHVLLELVEKISSTDLLPDDLHIFKGNCIVYKYIYKHTYCVRACVGVRARPRESCQSVH